MYARNIGNDSPSRPSVGSGRTGSATDWRSSLAGVAGLATAFGILLFFRPFSNTTYSALFLLSALILSNSAVDLFCFKVHRRPTTALNFATWNPSKGRAFVKFTGLLAVIAVLGLLYAIFPEYSGVFYKRYFNAIALVLPFLILVGAPYIYIIDGFMVFPEDGLWRVGNALLGHDRRIDILELGQFILGWLVKFFFLPLMFTYVCGDIDFFVGAGISHLNNFDQIYEYVYRLLYFFDVCFATAGYILSLRLTDTHIRSTDPTLLGWVAAASCYEPFWSIIGAQYLAYDSGRTWGYWLRLDPLLSNIWGILILAFVSIYLWATIAFGCRFSNLTNRGIITNGPYRFTKHPAYIAKNLSWWLISMPFLGDDRMQAVRHCVLLLLLNGIYALRAVTEERHLSSDAGYVAYSRWIERHGMFSFFRPGVSRLDF
jgi:protein-S-isoprenylcysteine O-methyltransferase Ste14